MPDISYFLLGFLRQPNRAKARAYLGLEDGDDDGGGGVPGSGDVVGPAASTNNAITRYDGATGKLLQNSAPIVQDDGRISTVTDPTGAQDVATKNYVDSLAPGSGDVTGPAVAVDDNITTFDGVTGKLIQDSGVGIAVVPTVNQKAALAGTNGAPAAGNPYVTDSDPRNTNARTPAAHESTHESGNSDALTGLIDANARVSVNLNSGATVGTRRRINFVEGANIAITVADDAGNEEVDVEIEATGGGGSDWDGELTKPTDQTVTDNATPQNDTFLSTALLADTFYLIELQLVYSGNNVTGDYRGRFTFPTSVSGGVIGSFVGFSTTGTAQTTTAAQASLTQWPTGDILLFTDLEANLRTCLIRFQLYTAGAGGTLQYQFANNLAAAGRTSTTRAGSTLRWKAFVP